LLLLLVLVPARSATWRLQLLLLGFTGVSLSLSLP
jgi:hypothetical protein